MPAPRHENLMYRISPTDEGMVTMSKVAGEGSVPGPAAVVQFVSLTSLAVASIWYLTVAHPPCLGGHPFNDHLVAVTLISFPDLHVRPMGRA